MPFDTEQLKRYLERQRSSIDQPKPSKSLLINVADGGGAKAAEPEKGAPKNTVITIRSNNEFTITNSGSSLSDGKSAPTLMVTLDTNENEKVTSNKSISSSSQGICSSKTNSLDRRQQAKWHTFNWQS